MDVVPATGPGAPLVWPDVANNVVFDWGIGDKAATDALFATAAHAHPSPAADTNVISAGRVSIRITFWAASGPRFVAVCV